MTTSAIIVAAGSSRRMGFDKLFAKLAGKPVISHSIAAFERCPQISEIIVVTRQDLMDAVRKVVQAGKFTKVTKIIAGGTERHHSVWNGLLALNEKTKFVAIHDGARPLDDTQADCQVPATCEAEGRGVRGGAGVRTP